MSGKAKRRREREREAAAAADGTALRQAHAEHAFHRSRVVVIGNDRALWRVRQPVFAYVNETLWEVERGFRLALERRGLAVAPDVDPLVVAAQVFAAHGVGLTL